MHDIMARVHDQAWRREIAKKIIGWVAWGVLRETARYLLSQWI